MIFVSLGSQQYQFNRLLKEIDRLIESGEIQEDVFAQTGASTYEPRNFDYQKFLSSDEYKRCIQSADIVITHGGTGAIIGAIKAHKQVIAVPRQAKYEEHADDHQFQIVEFMEENGYIRKVVEMDELRECIYKAQCIPVMKEFKSSGRIIEIIDSYIEKCGERNK